MSASETTKKNKKTKSTAPSPAKASEPSPTNSTNNEASDPPPRESLVYTRLRFVKAESNGPFDMCGRLIVAICASVLGTIFLTVIVALPVTSIVIGSIYLEYCKVERYIPIYLIVEGCFGFLNICLTGSMRTSEYDTGYRYPGAGVVSCFLLVWFVAGNVWVFRVYNYVDTEDDKSLDYCHPVCYWYAFALIICIYSIMVLFLCCICFACCLMVFVDEESVQVPA